MRIRTWILTLSLLLSFPCLAEEEATQGAAIDAPPQFDTYFMVFLKAAENRDNSDPEATMDIQRQHRAHLRKLREDGKILAAGPLEAPEGHPLRGIVFYRGDLAPEDVERMAGADPAVQAGRLKVEVLRWWTPKGEVSFGAEP